jgi:hypothetical protein
MKCREPVGDVDETIAALRNIADLTLVQQQRLARKLRINPVTLQGLTIMARWSGYVADWLTYHDRPLTHENIRILQDEMDQIHRLNNFPWHNLYSDLQLGATLLLNHIRRDPDHRSSRIEPRRSE